MVVSPRVGASVLGRKREIKIRIFPFDFLLDLGVLEQRKEVTIEDVDHEFGQSLFFLAARVFERTVFSKGEN